MTGVLWPASRTRETISGTAAAASLLLTVTRTSSDPALASSITCRAVPVASAVSVLVIDCTTTALHPPTRTPPMMTATDCLRSIFAIGSRIDVIGLFQKETEFYARRRVFAKQDRLFDIHARRVGRHAINHQRKVHFSTPRQIPRQSSVYLIQSCKIALRSGKKHWRVYPADFQSDG